MTRRPPGDGSLYYDPRRQRWVGQVDITGPGGKRRRRKVSAKTRGEATALLRGLVSELRRSGTVGRQDVTVTHVIRDFLQVPPPDWSEATASLNAGHGRRIIDGLGQVRLANLTARDVEQFLFALAEGDNPLAASTITQTRSLLVRAIRRAQRDGITSRNAAADAILPRAGRRRSRALIHSEVAALLALDLSPWWRAFITTGLSVGLRSGELLGLRWEDVDFENSVVRVRRSLKEVRSPDGYKLVLDSLKTERSRRTVAMPGTLAVALRAHRMAQTEQRLASGGDYEDHGLVFPAPGGRPRYRGHVRRKFERLCHQAGIERIVTLHEMRHTWVSLLSDGGVPIEAIADAAGHANPGITGRVYRHVIADRVNVSGASVMDEILGREVR